MKNVKNATSFEMFQLVYVVCFDAVLFLYLAYVHISFL